MSDLAIGDDTVVAISYTLKNSDGHVLDTASLGQPLTYAHGTGAVLPGLEAALVGHVEGDTLQLIIPPQQGYGERAPDMTREVPRDVFPSTLRLHRGMPFALEFKDSGLSSQLWYVSEVHRDKVVLDGNHPLAGETLYMDVRVVSVRPTEPGDHDAEDLARIEGWGT
ncbi:MAG: peptidylprolyl isomerase [Myxococcales bacterium]|nr:peptidylprolyl isomerase [Myxococcales bacterium]